MTDLGAERKQPDPAERAVAAIVRDLTDRRGIKWAWHEIDTDVQAEIRRRWAELIRREYAKETGP